MPTVVACLSYNVVVYLYNPALFFCFAVQYCHLDDAPRHNIKAVYLMPWWVLLSLVQQNVWLYSQ